MAEQVNILEEKQNLSLIDNFHETIEVCGSRLCWDCALTGNSNFMKSEEYCFCQKCQGTGRETYYERIPNPNYGKKPEHDILGEYKYKKQVEKIFEYLSSTKNLDGKYLKTYKRSIDVYEKLGGIHPLLEKTKLNVKRLEKQNKKINTMKTFYEYCSNEKFIKKPEYLENIKIELEKTERLDDTSTRLSYYINKNIDLIKSIQESSMKKAIVSPVAPNTFTTPSPKTFDHIPNLNKLQEPVVTIKPVKWNEWCQFESDNGGFIDIMGRHYQLMGQALAEQEKIRWMKKFIDQYRKYAEHCIQQNVEPEPIPDVDVLRRRLEWITLSNGRRIYNKHYDPPGCIIG